MKGITLVSDIFLLIALLAITVIMSLVIWLLILTFQVESKFAPGGMPTTRGVELELFIKPDTYNSLMSAFLEYEHKGISMKKILETVAIQENINVWLEGKGINATLVSESFLAPQINNDYILKIGDITVAKSGSFSSETSTLSLQKVSTILFDLNGKEVYMQLFVAD